MELTYKIRGIDGQEYGPATLAQLSSWIQEGRITATHEVQRSDMGHWSIASHFEELKSLFSSLAQPPPIPSALPLSRPTRPEVPAEIKSRGSWFYWIGALSLINSIAAFSGGNWRFFFGLGVTQLLDAVAGEFGSTGKAIVFGMDLAASALCVLFGYFACKGYTWAFLVGMILFGLDGAIFLLSMDWIAVLLHAYVLFRLFQGFQASREATNRQ